VKYIFNKGLKDAQSGKPRTIPKNDHSYNTLRGEISLWLPSRNFSTLYNTGFEYAGTDEAGVARIEASLGETVADLFSKLELDYPEGLLGEILGTTDINKNDTASADR